MSRVLALVLLLGVIVASGFWLARDRAGAGAATTQAAAAAPAPPAGQAGGDDGTVADAGGQLGEEAGSDAPPVASPAAAEAPRDPGPPPRAAEEAAPPTAGEPGLPALPEGYVPVDYLTDSPVHAFSAPGSVLENGLDYIAVLRTDRGDITVDLYEGLTPVTVNNFVFLALNRYYDGVPFHRVLEGFMAQTGDPTGTGRGGPGYQFDDEIVPELGFDARGVLAMANAGKTAAGGTNGSQFFITFEPTQWLDGNHTIFGKVIAGDEVLDAITRVDPGTPRAVAFFDDTVASLRDQGVDLPGAEDETVAAAVEAALGTMPISGQSFSLAGFVGAVGQAGGQPAFGFFPVPDTLETVIIAARPQG